MDEHIVTPSSSSDGGDDYRNSMTMEGTKPAEVAKDVAAEEDDSAEESAEGVKMKERTPVEAEAADNKSESLASEAKDAVSTELGAIAGGKKAGLDHSNGLDLRCKQCGQRLPEQQAPDAHITEARPSEAPKTEILKLVDDRFNAPVEEQHGDARKEPERVVEAQPKASTPIQESTEPTVILRETTEARDAVPHDKDTTGARTKLLQEATKAKAGFSGGTNKLRSEASPFERQAQESHDVSMLRSQERYDLRVRRTQEEYDIRMLRSQEDYDRRTRWSQEDHDHGRLKSQEDHDRDRLKSQEDHDRDQLKAQEDHNRHLIRLQEILAPSGGKDNPSK
jgi:hypothetical protein